MKKLIILMLVAVTVVSCYDRGPKPLKYNDEQALKSLDSMTPPIIVLNVWRDVTIRDSKGTIRKYDTDYSDIMNSIQFDKEFGDTLKIR